MTKNKPTDTKIKYVFIKDFKWNPMLADPYPMNGRVYPSVFNVHSEQYTLLLPDHTMLTVKSLIEVNDKYESNLIELSRENILDFDIKEEDLDLINEEIKQEVPVVEQGLIKLRDAMHQHDQDEATAADQTFYVMMNLWKANALKHQIVLDIAEHLTTTDLESYADPANYLRLHETKGLGLNIAQALRSLDRYAGDDRKTSEDLPDLFNAVEAIVVELERRYSNELE